MRQAISCHMAKRIFFLENVKGTALDQKKESEANAFAAKQLLTNAQLQKIIQSPLSEDDIRAFAKKNPHIPWGNCRAHAA